MNFRKNPMKINGFINEVIECDTMLSKNMEKAIPIMLDIAIIPLILIHVLLWITQV